MRDNLPPYIVRCFLTAGFDTTEVISSMDTSEDTGNSISAIESFIMKYYPGHKDLCCTPAPAPGVQQPFVFPPGHRIRITNFISEVKRKYHAPRSKRKLLPNASYSKKKKTYSDCETSDIESKLTFDSVSNQVRTGIAKWTRKQSCHTLKNLQENKHFTITVTKVPKSDNFSVSIRCKACNTNIRLCCKQTSYLISNWTRHMKLCEKLRSKECSKQQPLNRFLSPEPASTDLSSFDDTSSVDLSSSHSPDNLESSQAAGGSDESSQVNDSAENCTESNLSSARSSPTHTLRNALPGMGSISESCPKSGNNCSGSHNVEDTNQLCKSGFFQSPFM